MVVILKRNPKYGYVIDGERINGKEAPAGKGGKIVVSIYPR